MKTGRKMLSVLLALLLLLSLSAAAAGAGTDDGYNWKPIPTSPEGLNTGDYWLDWSYVAQTLDIESTLTVAELLQCFNDGTYFFDEDKADMKGTFTIPKGMAGLTEDEVTEFKPGDYDTIGFLRMSLTQVGLEWKPVATSTDGLQNGDWYFDFEALTDSVLDIEMKADIAAGHVPADTDKASYLEYQRTESIAAQEVPADVTPEDFYAFIVNNMKELVLSDGKTYYVNPMDSALLKLKVETPFETAIGPNKKIEIRPFDWIAQKTLTDSKQTDLALYLAAIKQYKDPATPDEPQPDPNMCHWCGQVHEGFFQKIIGFFHNILAKIFGNKY